MEYPKRSHYKHAKSQYRVRNWREYEVAYKDEGTSPPGCPMTPSTPGGLHPAGDPAASAWS